MKILKIEGTKPYRILQMPNQKDFSEQELKRPRAINIKAKESYLKKLYNEKF